MRARNENKQIAESYSKVLNEVAPLVAGAGRVLAQAAIPVLAGAASDALEGAGDEETPIETGGCGHAQPDIAAVAAQAIAAITELATAAGASISVTVDIGEAEIDRFNAGHEDVGST